MFVNANIIYVTALIITNVLPNIQRFFLLYTASKIEPKKKITHNEPKFIASLTPSVRATPAGFISFASTFPNSENSNVGFIFKLVSSGSELSLFMVSTTSTLFCFKFLITSFFISLAISSL